jgi:hypothetical protein
MIRLFEYPWPEINSLYAVDQGTAHNCEKHFYSVKISSRFKGEIM